MQSFHDFVSRLKDKRVDILVLTLVLLTFALVFSRLVSSQPFSYDESDYLYAASKGFVASYLDRPSVSLIEFVKTGVRDGLRSETWRDLSDHIRRSDDITLYRHFHAPLYFYWLTFVSFVSGQKEFIVRLSSLFSLMFDAIVVYIGSSALLGKHGRFVGLLAIGFLLLSPTSLETARWVTPHALYCAFAMGTLFSLAKLIQSKNLRYLYGASIWLALAFLTIEYAPLLLIVLVVTVFIDRHCLFPNWSLAEYIRLISKCVLILLLVIGSLWPAALYKMSIIKSYGFFGYYAMIRNREYGTESLSQVWWTRIVSSPLEFFLLLVLSSFLVYLFTRGRTPRYLLPFALYAVLVFLTTVRNRSESSYYVSSLIPCLGFISAFAVLQTQEIWPKFRVAIAGFVLVTLCANNFWFYYRVEAKRPPDERWTALVDILRHTGAGTHRVLVPADYVPTVHYYFQASEVQGYTIGSGAQQIVNRLVNGNFDEIIYEGRDFKKLQDLLEKRWSLSSVVKPEVDKPGRAIAYYRLLALIRSLAQAQLYYAVGAGDSSGVRR